MEDHYKGKIREWDRRIAESPYDGELRYKRGASKNCLDEIYASQKTTEKKHTAEVLHVHAEIERKQIQLAHSMLDDFNSALELNFREGSVYFERALVRLSSVLKTPNDDAANRERFEKAKRDLAEAVAKGVDEQEILGFRGDAKRKLGEFHSAMSDYRKIKLAEQEADGKAMCYARIARTQFKLKQYEEAIASAKQALVLCANIPHEYAHWRGRIKQSAFQTSAESYVALESWEEARSALDKYLAIRPDKIKIWMLRAKANFMLKNYQEAVNDCEKVIYEDGDNEEARTLREAATKFRDSALQGPPVGMSRGEVPPPPPPAFNPAWSAAQGGYAGSPTVGTLFSADSSPRGVPSAPPRADLKNNVVQRPGVKGGCSIM